MRILLLNQYYAPDEAATAQILSDAGAALARRGHEVVALTSNRSYADLERTYQRDEVIDGVRVHRIRATAFGRSSRTGRLLDYLTFYAGAVFTLLFSKKPDVVVALTTPPMISLVASAIGRIRRFSTVFWCMDVYPDIAYELGALQRESVAGRVFDWLSRKALALASTVIALGDTMAERLRRAGARHVVVVHNWADEAVERSGEDPLGDRSREAFRAQRGWGDALVVMYSGNLGLAHEFDTLLDAAKLVQEWSSAPAPPQPSEFVTERFSKRRSVEPRREIIFAFVGGGPRKGEVQRRAEAMELRNVRFYDYVAREELGASLTAGDVHVVTLRPKMPGLLVPSKIYGILAAGRPVIYVGPRRGEVHEIVARGACGVVIDNGDAHALRSAILAYADDRDALERESGNARELFAREFTRVRSIGAFVRVVEASGGETPSSTPFA